MLSASAWKFLNEDDGPVYRIQVNGIDGRTRDIVEKSLEDWHQSGEGWNNNGQILFFIKKFKDVDGWEEWITRFKEFSLKVLDREGKAKKEIKVEAPVVLDTGGRVCSICKQKGHNSRTCKTLQRKEATKIDMNIVQPVKSHVAIDGSTGKRTCSKCNQKGHNSRTCVQKSRT